MGVSHDYKLQVSDACFRIIFVEDNDELFEDYCIDFDIEEGRCWTGRMRIMLDDEERWCIPVVFDTANGLKSADLAKTAYLATEIIFNHEEEDHPAWHIKANMISWMVDRIEKCFLELQLPG